MSRTPELERPVRVIESALTAIDIYWDNILEFPQNTLQVTSREPDPNGGPTVQETFTIQRFYETAYFIKCERSGLTSWGGGNSPIFNDPIETIEYRMTPDLLQRGKINVTHVDAATGLSVQEDLLIDKLAEADSVAAQTLRNLEINTLALLIGHCKELDIFSGEELIKTVREALSEAFGPRLAEEMWRAGMFGEVTEE